jgi:hypothetical protein
MDPEAFLEPEVAVAVVVTAALSSKRARKVMRTGAVYGIAGLLKAGNALRSMAGTMQQNVAATAGLAGAGGEEEVRTEPPVRPTAPRRAAQAARHEAAPVDVVVP